MKKALWSTGAALLLMSFSVAFAESKKAEEVTLTGTLTCGKCGLHEAKKCEDTLVVKDGDKSVNYVIAKSDASKDLHGKICKANVENAKVTGTVKEEGGKKVITASKIEH